MFEEDPEAEDKVEDIRQEKEAAEDGVRNLEEKSMMRNSTAPEEIREKFADRDATSAEDAIDEFWSGRITGRPPRPNPESKIEEW